MMALALGVDQLPAEVARVALTIVIGMVLLVVVRRGLGWMATAVARIEVATGRDHRRISRRIGTLESFFVRALESFILVAVVTIVLAELGVRIEALLASAGIVGIAIAFGAQTIVRDSLSGLFILIQGPFDVGDYVRLNTVEGTVAQIALRSTTLTTDDGAVHTVANGAITQTTNFTRFSWSHVLTLTVTRTTPLELVQRDVDEVATELAGAPEIGDDVVSGPAVRGISAIRGASYDVEVRSVVRPGLRPRYPTLVLGLIARSCERNEVELA